MSEAILATVLGRAVTLFASCVELATPRFASAPISTVTSDGATIRQPSLCTFVGLSIAMCAFDSFLKQDLSRLNCLNKTRTILECGERHSCRRCISKRSPKPPTGPVLLLSLIISP